MPQNPEPDLLSKGLAKVRWRKSLILLFADLMRYGLSAISPLVWLARSRMDRRQDYLPFWWVEIWLISLCIIEAIVLYLATGTGLRWPYWIWVAFALYVLADNIGALLRDVFLGPDIHDGDFVVRDRGRWVAATAICAVEVILAFAIIYRIFGDEFDFSKEGAVCELYFSLVTFATVGYGDVKPITELGMWLVVSEILFVLLFIGFKLPVAVTIFLKSVRGPRAFVPTDNREI
jgi:hypothetical protein